MPPAKSHAKASLHSPQREISSQSITMPSFNGNHTQTSNWQLVLFILYIAAVAGLPTTFTRRYCQHTVEINLRTYCFMQHDHYTHMQYAAILPHRDADCVRHQHAEGQQKPPANHRQTAVAYSYARCHRTTSPVTPLHSHYYKKKHYCRAALDKLMGNHYNGTRTIQL